MKNEKGTRHEPEHRLSVVDFLDKDNLAKKQKKLFNYEKYLIFAIHKS